MGTATAAHRDAVSEARERLAVALETTAPPRRVLVSEWAAGNVILSREVSPEPGPWDNDRAPYQREMMDSVCDPDVEEVVFCTSAQVGKTSIIGNVLAYFIDQDPCAILAVQPTVDLAEAWSKERLAPMIAASPVLRRKVRAAKSRDSDNTILNKRFPGGRLSIVGANAPSSLASRPVRVVLCDEVDRFPASAGTEGDPVALARKRTENFWNRKLILTSTPTLKGMSRIEEAWGESDQRRFHVPCPKCSEMQALRWQPAEGRGGIVFAHDEAGKVVPGSVAYQCGACGERIEEAEKWRMLHAGRWVATFEDRRIRGYHLNALYSPWRRWDEVVDEWEAARKNPERLKVFVNTVLGETWEESGEGVGADTLKARLERYDGEVPTGVGVLVAGVDVQIDRLEVVVKGYGVGEESWLIAHYVLVGDPEHERVWGELDTLIRGTWTHKSGAKLRLECVAVDSGGQSTERVYRFCSVRAGRRVFAVKGAAGAREIVGRPSLSERYRTKLYIVGVDTAKDMLFGRMRVRVPGPGYLHLPVGVEEEYLEQLTAERAVLRWKRGRGRVREWVKTRERNEALDCEVYALAALHILGGGMIRILGERARRFAGVKVEKVEAKAGAAVGQKGVAGGRRTGGGWVGGWRR